MVLSRLLVRSAVIGRNIFGLVALVCLGAVLSTTVGPVTAASGSPANIYADKVGMNSHAVWLSEPDAVAALAPVAAGGVSWIREELPWDQLEPSPGQHDWTKGDNLMAAASRVGVNVLGILDHSAPWASSDPSGRGDTKYPPSSNADYAAFTAAVVARYGTGGTFWASRPDLVPRPLTAIELWNEPAGWWNWMPEPDPVAYGRMVRAAAGAARAVRPDIQILMQGDLLQVRQDGAIESWLDRVLTADPGLGGLISALSVHPYPSPRQQSPDATPQDARWSYSRVPLSRQVELDHGLTQPLWITEIGWTTATGVPDGVSEADQSSFLVSAVRTAATTWGSYVGKVFAYTWDRSSGAAGDIEGNYSLRRVDGSPKPAWPALVALIAAGPGRTAAASAAGGPAAPGGTAVAPRAARGWQFRVCGVQHC